MYIVATHLQHQAATKGRDFMMGKFQPEQVEKLMLLNTSPGTEEDCESGKSRLLRCGRIIMCSCEAFPGGASTWSFSTQETRANDSQLSSVPSCSAPLKLKPSVC